MLGLSVGFCRAAPPAARCHATLFSKRMLTKIQNLFDNSKEMFLGTFVLFIPPVT
jgi:hypothetical protein